MQMQTKIYLACVRPLQDDKVFARFFAQASQERKDKIMRYRFEKDRLLSLGADALLLHALRENGFYLEELVCGYGEKGKPFLPQLPDFRFNWSHSGEYVMLAVSDREVGCDIEQIRPVELKLAQFAFDPREYERVAACCGAERDKLFFRYWVLKESYMKALGEGLSLGPQTFRIKLGDAPAFKVDAARQEAGAELGNSSVVKADAARQKPGAELGNSSVVKADAAGREPGAEEPIRVIKDGVPQNFSFLEGGGISGYRYALCLEGPLPRIETEIVDLQQVPVGFM